MKKQDFALVLLLGAIVAALFFKHLPLSLPDVRLENAAGEFNAMRAVDRLARILGDERPHPVDSDANDAVRERLLAEIEALGFQAEVRDDFTCRTMTSRSRVTCARVQNVLFRAGPPGSDAVMIASHYDSVPAGPGAGDDGIGVAVSLEIAKLLADAPPKRPVVFLITDGEEMGLLGAHSFVTTDPIAADIDAVINLEARGVRGPAQMFQTSDPNSADVAAFVKGAARPFANSMMTDIYRRLPNDTDVTEFLPMGYDAINLALTEGVEFYHTPHDNLRNLDRRSVQHLGDNALVSVRNLVEAGGRETAETQVIFADILSRFTVTAPQWLGGLAVILALMMAAAAFLRAKGPRPLRSALTPVLSIVLAGGVAFGLQYGLGALRPEAQYWMAHPQAMQAVAYLSAALGAIVALKEIGAGAGRDRLLHASWFWLAAIATGIYAIAPGASILFALPLAAYAIGGLASLFAPALATLFAAIASLLMLIVFAPALHLAEIGLGFSATPVFAVVAALIVVSAAPLALAEENRISAAPPIAILIFLAFAFAAALAVPGYSPAKPQPMNIIHFTDADAKTAQWVIGMEPGEKAPEEMAALGAFAPADIPGLGLGRLAAPAPFAETPAPDFAVLGAEGDGETRTLRIAIAANGADAVYARIPEDAKIVAVTENGERSAFGGDGVRTLFCAGRACDGAEFEVELAGEPQDWWILGVRFGLPYDAWPLVNARPDAATAIQNGDVSIVRAQKRM